MWIHLHSLYAGILFLAIVGVCRFPLSVGLFCIPFCLAVDFGQFISRFQKGRQPWQFAFGSLLQSLVLYGVFALASVVVGGSVHAAMGSFAPNRGATLYWHGSTEGVEAATRNGLFAHGTGNGSKFWATTRGEQGALTEILVGGNRNIESLIPFRTSSKGGFEAVYKLTAEEASSFSRAWGFRYSFNPYQWYKSGIGQYVYHPGTVSWAQRGTELGRAGAITTIIGGGAWGGTEVIDWWNGQ